MEHWTEFVLARYNYWIVIVLMMLGLYIVFARGNLVKKIVGLNIFQTSVFIFYITIGKIAGGTAPIYTGDDLDFGGHGDGHGDGHEADGHEANGHGNDVGGGHGEPAGHSDAGHESVSGHADAADASLHGKIDNALGVNDLKSAASGSHSGGEAASLHDAPSGVAKISNDALVGVGKEVPEPGFSIASDAMAPDGTVLDSAASYSDAIYSNPLPHVLILTAIVVGVAGTAVGLALAVRIREAYGTIEEDELEAIDNIAEFGEDAERAAGVVL